MSWWQWSLGNGKDLRIVTREVLLAKDGRGCVHTHMHMHSMFEILTTPERSEMWPILVSYPLELVHLDFLTLVGKADDHRSVNILIVTDYFPKYAQAYITPKQIAVVVA